MNTLTLSDGRELSYHEYGDPQGAPMIFNHGLSGSRHVEMFCGDADNILDVKMPLHLAKRLPDCTTHVWEGADHYGFVDRWLDFLRAAV
jgi:pimeloyl-ACP methyl ester carboxylesterase